jgi:2'-phosphotransferase
VNEKQRFSMIPARSDTTALPSVQEEIHETPQEQDQTADFASDDPKDYLIRANQGHSLKVDAEGLLTPITKEAGNIPSVCVHGTNEAAWQSILKSGGLRRMTRNHIHFASGLPKGFKSLDDATASEIKGKEKEEKEAPPIISGMRNSSTILIYVDVEAAMNAGIKFYVSKNGVILSEGDEKGVLACEFFKRVEARKIGTVLMRDGVLPDGVIVDVRAWEREFGGNNKGQRGK